MKKTKRKNRKVKRWLTVFLILAALLLSAWAVQLVQMGKLTLPFSLAWPGTSSAGLADPSELVIPPYDGQDYAVLCDGRPCFTAEDLSAAPHVSFSPFDALGRTGAGSALVGPETRPTEPRGEIGDIRPSGWHTVRYDDLIEDHFLYNRCHVIGYLLCGDNATPENLFTGTGYLNSGTMLTFERDVSRYIGQTGNHVAYRVTPVYDGNNLVATGVRMEACSVEDRGSGLCFHIFAYNIQPGVLIDYRTGQSRRDPNFRPA